MKSYYERNRKTILKKAKGYRLKNKDIISSRQRAKALLKRLTNPPSKTKIRKGNPIRDENIKCSGCDRAYAVCFVSTKPYCRKCRPTKAEMRSRR